MNKNFTIPAFAEPITGLPDTPTCAANELKRRFQAPADEVRTAHNALAEAHETLTHKVGSMITETFEGVIDKTMLAPELADELDAKATENALSGEETARKNADNALSSRVSSLESSVPQKARIVYGTYTGDGTDNRLISVGFRPRLVIISRVGSISYYGMMTDMATMMDGANTKITTHPVQLESNGFRVSRNEYDSLSYDHNFNESGISFGYVAIGV